MNYLEQAIKTFGPHEINEKMYKRRLCIGRVAVKPPPEGLLNKTYKHEAFASDTLCEWIIDKSEEHAVKNGGWTKKRHKNYPTTDLPIKSIHSIYVPLFNLATINILPLIADHYKLNLYFLNIVDLFIIKYDIDGQDHLENHRDGSIISFNILLNDEFEGGGTKIYHPNNEGNVTETLYTSKKGDLFIHPGKLLHSGNKITSGRRYILVGFVEFCNNIYTPKDASTLPQKKEIIFEQVDSLEVQDNTEINSICSNNIDEVSTQKNIAEEVSTVTQLRIFRQ